MGLSARDEAGTMATMQPRASRRRAGAPSSTRRGFGRALSRCLLLRARAFVAAKVGRLTSHRASAGRCPRFAPASLVVHERSGCLSRPAGTRGGNQHAERRERPVARGGRTGHGCSDIEQRAPEGALFISPQQRRPVDLPCARRLEVKASSIAAACCRTCARRDAAATQPCRAERPGAPRSHPCAFLRARRA